MKRLAWVALFVLGVATAGTFSGVVVADVTTSTASTTSTAATTTAPTTTTTPVVATIPAGVRVAGVKVGGLVPAEAVASVRAAFARPLPVIVDRSTLALDPAKVASVYVPTAVAKARVARPGTNIQLVVAPRGDVLRAWAGRVDRRFEKKAVDARLVFRNAKPVITPERPGRRLDTKLLVRKVVAALRANSRLPVRVKTNRVAPQVTASSIGKVIVISREQNRLWLYDGEKLVRAFPVATGQAIYPTPRGLWHIVVKWKNPWWYPPVNDSWARGLKPVPPGPGNPLGTRWMGLDAPGVGIHGTDEPTSIGYSASHGCIRMQVPDAEWLFDRVDVGTTVYIV